MASGGRKKDVDNKKDEMNLHPQTTLPSLVTGARKKGEKSSRKISR